MSFFFSTNMLVSIIFMQPIFTYNISCHGYFVDTIFVKHQARHCQRKWNKQRSSSKCYLEMAWRWWFKELMASIALIHNAPLIQFTPMDPEALEALPRISYHTVLSLLICRICCEYMHHFVHISHLIIEWDIYFLLKVSPQALQLLTIFECRSHFTCLQKMALWNRSGRQWSVKETRLGELWNWLQCVSHPSCTFISNSFQNISSFSVKFQLYIFICFQPWISACLITCSSCTHHMNAIWRDEPQRDSGSAGEGKRQGHETVEVLSVRSHHDQQGEGAFGGEPAGNQQCCLQHHINHRICVPLRLSTSIYVYVCTGAFLTLLFIYC